jgi:hypothetical protein
VFAINIFILNCCLQEEEGEWPGCTLKEEKPTGLRTEVNHEENTTEEVILNGDLVIPDVLFYLNNSVPRVLMNLHGLMQYIELCCTC